MKKVKIIDHTSPLPAPLKGLFCATFFSRFKGLMFNHDLKENECIILDEGNESIMNTTIHMFFMFFDIAVVWVDRDFKIVDVKLAKKWMPYYAPSHPARYVLEARPKWVTIFHIGDQLQFYDE
jgi:uncharacterized membrane protein (UPF0127 family)